MNLKKLKKWQQKQIYIGKPNRDYSLLDSILHFLALLLVVILFIFFALQSRPALKIYGEKPCLNKIINQNKLY